MHELGWLIRFDSNTIQYGRRPNRINTLRYDTHTSVRRIVLTSPASCNTPRHNSSRAARSLLSSSHRPNMVFAWQPLRMAHLWWK